MTSQTRQVSEGFYIDLYERAPDLICSVDLQSGTIKACNETYAESLGYTKEEVLGREPVEFYHAESRDRVRRAYDALVEAGEVSNVEVQMQRADGSVFDVSLSATAIEEEGEVVATRSAIRDITDLKEAERELEERARRLEQSNRELEQFAYLASHDLQEPLRMVASYTQLLERRYKEELDAKAKKYIDYAVEGAERMKALLNDLLTYSRLERPEREIKPVDLEDVLESVCTNLRLRIAESEAEIEWSELPEVEGNESQLIQLFQNLVENGIKFQEAGRPVVEIAAEPDGAYSRITVTDNGIGFDTANADRVFQIFQRLQKRDEYEGTGAGLAIVKKLVEANDGTIEVESTEGEGTTFSVRLPSVEREGESDG